MITKEYHRKYNRERYHRLRTKYIILLGGKCSNCGSIENLEFDHIDKTTKEIEIGFLLNYSQDRIKKELKNVNFFVMAAIKKKIRLIMVRNTAFSRRNGSP